SPGTAGEPSSDSEGLDGAEFMQEDVVCVEGAGDTVETVGVFHPPGRGCSLELAKLVSGASLNACRCCLELGSRDSLQLALGRLSGCSVAWINLVAELGEGAKADAYRDHMFKLLWRAAATYEQPALAAPPARCLAGRVRALGFLEAKEASSSSWDADFYLGQVYRAGVSLERLKACGEGGGGRTERP
ncbi:unnamed protein product, partial [Discosporangium mesarthrocarpum]